MPLTILFAVEIITFCYLLYSILFFDQTLDQFIYFSFYLIELGGFLFAVIYRASVVDRHNNRCYAGNVQACVLFQLCYSESVSPRLMANVSGGGEANVFSMGNMEKVVDNLKN